MKFQEDLTAYIRAGYPLLYVSALEPERAISSIEKVCESINGGLSCHVWKITDGWDGSGSGDDPDEIFQYVDERQVRDSVSVLCNYHSYIGENPNPVLIQRFMDSYFKWKTPQDHRTVIILSPMYKLTPELERFFQTLNYTLPELDTIASLVDSFADMYKDQFTWESEKHRESVISNACGMTQNEVESALALSVVKTKMATDIPSISPEVGMEEKAKILSKSGF